LCLLHYHIVRHLGLESQTKQKNLLTAAAVAAVVVAGPSLPRVVPEPGALSPPAVASQMLLFCQPAIFSNTKSNKMCQGIEYSHLKFNVFFSSSVV